MKVSAALFILIACASAHAADPSITCLYKPSARTSENLPLNANTLYVDVESPKDSFLLLGKPTDSLLQQAQEMITQRKIEAGTVYAFERGEATETKISVTISPILTGQMTNNVPQIIDFSTAPPPKKAGGPSIAPVADGVSCSLTVEQQPK